MRAEWAKKKRRKKSLINLCGNKSEKRWATFERSTVCISVRATTTTAAAPQPPTVDSWRYQLKPEKQSTAVEKQLAHTQQLTSYLQLTCNVCASNDACKQAERSYLNYWSAIDFRASAYLVALISSFAFCVLVVESANLSQLGHFIYRPLIRSHLINRLKQRTHNHFDCISLFAFPLCLRPPA